MRLTLVRHGETTGLSSVRYYGATDVPLSEIGRAQMQRVRAALAAERFDAAFSSRLCRSVDAAALIVGSRVAVTPVAAFDEVNFGRWEGWTREEIAERDPDTYRDWQTLGPSFTYPGGESRLDFHTRVAAGLNQVLRNRDGQHMLMVLHKGVIASILTELLNMRPSQRATLGIDLASIHVLVQGDGQWNAQCLNRIEHLQG